MLSMGDRSTRSTQSQELLEAGRVFRGWGLCMEFWRLSSIGTWSVEDQLGANGGQGAFFGILIIVIFGRSDMRMLLLLVT